MRVTTKGLSLVFLIVTCASLVLVGGGNIDPDRRQVGVAHLLHEWLEGARQSAGSPAYQRSQAAFRQLADLPGEDVLPILIGAFAGDSRFRDVTVRRGAYALLVAHHAEEHEDGRAQLFHGLTEEDRHIPRYAGEALGRAPTSVRERAVRVLGDTWFDVGRFPVGAVAALGFLGQPAEQYLPMLTTLWSNVKADTAARSAALQTIIRIDGFGRVAGLLRDVDPVARKIGLNRFGREGWDTDGAFDGDPGHQQTIRDFVVESFESPSRDVRRAAFESLIWVFGDDGIVFHSPTEYEINPQIEQVLERMAATDPDESLRSQAAKALEQLRGRVDHVAQKILRKRQETQEKLPGGTDDGS